MNNSESFNCSTGYFIPTNVEAKWPIPLRAFLYLLALAYCFVGIAILSDVFMCAIERITNTTVKVKVSKKNEPVRYKEVRIWNPTVANLTLMALGSAAPEILLSIIEVMGHGFNAGALGPGSIVGAAAYNMLMINAVCTLAFKNGEGKRISKIEAFSITAVWDVFSYLWLVVILIGSSPNEIEVWEGALTLAMYPSMIISTYLVAKYSEKCFCKPRDRSPSTPRLSVEKMPVSDVQIVITGVDDDQQEVDESSSNYHPEWHELVKDAKLEFPDATDYEIAKYVASKIRADQPKDYLEYRIEAIRRLSKSSSKDTLSMRSEIIRKSSKSSMEEVPLKPIKLEFASRVYCVDPAKDKEIQLRIVRRGPLARSVSFRYETVDGIAKEATHFVQKSENVVMRSGEFEKIITVPTVQSDQWKPLDVFNVKLETLVDPNGNVQVKTGKCNFAEIRYFNGDENFSNKSVNTVEFVKHCVNVKFGQGYVRLPVIRKGSCQDKAFVEWATQTISEKFVDVPVTKGKIKFYPSEMETYVDIPLDENALAEKDKTFLVKLLNPSENVVIGKVNVVAVTSDGFTRLFKKLDTMIPKFLRKLEPGKQTWLEQFYEKLNVNGGDSTNASIADYVGHVIAFPWKAICAFIPPPIYLGGWLTFVISLGVLGLITAFVEDIASTFGCLINLYDTVTAITFVALGTSVPDTFASRIAAKRDKTADNAIVNITGSNTANVFLGLGIPWFIASIYWSTKGQTFQVRAGDLGFCVTLYACCAFLCLSLLFARRNFSIFGKMELGGPTVTKWMSAIFLITIWLLYILLSSLHVYGHIKAPF